MEDRLVLSNDRPLEIKSSFFIFLYFIILFIIIIIIIIINFTIIIIIIIIFIIIINDHDMHAMMPGQQLRSIQHETVLSEEAF